MHFPKQAFQANRLICQSESFSKCRTASMRLLKPKSIFVCLNIAPKAAKPSKPLSNNHYLKIEALSEKLWLLKIQHIQF